MRLTPIALAAALLVGVSTAGRGQGTPSGKTFSAQEMKAAKADPKFYTLDPASVEIVPLGPVVSPQSVVPPGGPQISIPKPPGAAGGTLPTPPSAPGGGLAGEDPFVVINNIINIAERIWKIIEENKPVVDIKTTFATAVPEGITHWTQLQQWKPPEATSYGFYAKNLYGVRVIDVKYVVFRTCGGNWKGKGKFLTGVTVQPTSVSVAWGYKLSMGAEVTSIANVGTDADPIASMMTQLNWTIATSLKNEQGTSIYYVQGDGQFRELAGPFSNKARQQVREKLDAIPQARPLGPSVLGAEQLKAKSLVGF